MKHLLRLGYLGTNYCGFQVQQNGVSIQQKIQDALEHVYGERLAVKGCSRTDSGVHALSYYLTYETHAKLPDIPCKKLPLALNAVLPRDITVYEAYIVTDDFHVQHDVLHKTYVYKIWNTGYRNPFESDRTLFYPRRLNTDVLQRSAQHFTGTHDFRAFMAQGSKITETRRTINFLTVTREGDYVMMRVNANGFLYHMVRILTGTLLAVAEEKIKDEEIPKIIMSGDRKRAGATVPAHGLYLESVTYPASVLQITDGTNS